MMNDSFDWLVKELQRCLSANHRFIKRSNLELVKIIQTTPLLVDFTTIDEKIWALKTATATRPTCYCGSLTKFHAVSLKYHKFCSSACAAKNPETMENRISKRLNTDWVTKAQNTILTRYGKNGIKKLREDGVFNKFGVTNYFATDEFQSRMQSYNLAKYQVSSYSKTQECKDKYKETCLQRYSACHFSKSETYKKNKTSYYEKQQARVKLEHSVEHSSQIKIKQVLPLILDHEWLYDQYIEQNKTTQQLVDELGISATTVLNYLHAHEIAIKYTNGYSRSCISWLEQTAKQHDIFIRHACNLGEFPIPGTRYRADGYCQETNTIYEFHGDVFHGNPDVFAPHMCPNPYSELTSQQLYDNTIQRETIIKSLGFNLVVMWENDWLQLKNIHVYDKL